MKITPIEEIKKNPPSSNITYKEADETLKQKIQTGLKKIHTTSGKKGYVIKTIIEDFLNRKTSQGIKITPLINTQSFLNKGSKYLNYSLLEFVALFIENSASVLANFFPYMYKDETEYEIQLSTIQTDKMNKIYNSCNDAEKLNKSFPTKAQFNESFPTKAQFNEMLDKIVNFGDLFSKEFEFIPKTSNTSSSSVILYTEEERKRKFKEEINNSDDGEFELFDDDIDSIFDGKHHKNYECRNRCYRRIF